MSGILLAMVRTLACLGRPRVWAMVLAPAAFSFLLWLLLVIWGRSHLAGWLSLCPPMPQLVSWGLPRLAWFLSALGSWMIIFALAYFSAALLAAIFVMPWLLGHVAARDYPDVVARGADSFSAAVANSLLATCVFALAWIVSIPLWLIPGLSLILPVLLMAWYNRRTFAYDALSLHATPEEWAAIRREHRRNLFLIGLVMSILTHVPLLGLLVPTVTALMFIHYCLEMLRRERGGSPLQDGGNVVLEGEFTVQSE